MKIKVLKTDFNHKNGYPKYETEFAAGLDVRANIDEPYILNPLDRILLPTGLRVEVPEGYELQVRPRSGLAIKYGITVLNTPGTIDADYRGDIGIVLLNASKSPYIVQPGERIGQIVLNKVEKIEWELVQTLTESNRGSNGFGSTGK